MLLIKLTSRISNFEQFIEVTEHYDQKRIKLKVSTKESVNIGQVF